MLQFLKRLMSPGPAPRSDRGRLHAAQWPSAVYAVGDVHGCRSELVAIQAMIEADAAGIQGEKWIVMLGDYVDRGPDSAGVLDTLCARPPLDMRRICLAGNHELMMLAFLADPQPSSDWLRFGGLETLQSYGVDTERLGRLTRHGRRDLLASVIPSEHVEFLNSLPLLLSLPGVVFAHAGIRPGVPLDTQSEEDLLWIREPFLSSPSGQEGLVVHGHTPVAEPEILPHRIGIDTGAFATGRLTAVRLSREGAPFFLSARAGQVRAMP